jgi:hypothetical protein
VETRRNNRQAQIHDRFAMNDVRIKPRLSARRYGGWEALEPVRVAGAARVGTAVHQSGLLVPP